MFAFLRVIGMVRFGDDRGLTWKTAFVIESADY
jgi:hypothetical protein